MTAKQQNVRILQGLEPITRANLDKAQSRLIRITEKHNETAREIMQAQAYLDEQYNRLENSEQHNPR